MTPLLLFLVGFVAAYLVGLKVRTRFALRQYEADIPRWVNQGNRAVIGTYDDILHAIEEAVHFQEWERQFEGER